MGKKLADVDDGLALISALTSNEIEIAGLSFGFGNINDLQFMERETIKILHKVGRSELPSYRGAEDKYQLGRSTDATEAIASALRKGPLKILALGRMTNIASTIILHPELKANIQEVVVNFGRRLEYEVGVGAKNMIMPDTNVDGDKDATKVLIDQKIPLTLIPTELMHDQLMNKQRMNVLRNGTPIARWMRRESLIWKFVWRIYPGMDGFIPWDVFVIGYLTDPDDFSCLSNIPIAIQNLPNNTIRTLRIRKRSKTKDFVVASPHLQNGSIGKYCYDVTDDHLDKWVFRWSNL
ncbi:MAG: nucleoside hydrolase [Bacteriovoracaceae bacterium]|nr:nucleoside hydrolase [Bacteriovoracaceae bacterium]